MLRATVAIETDLKIEKIQIVANSNQYRKPWGLSKL